MTDKGSQDLFAHYQIPSHHSSEKNLFKGKVTAKRLCNCTYNEDLNKRSYTQTTLHHTIEKCNLSNSLTRAGLYPNVQIEKCDQSFFVLRLFSIASFFSRKYLEKKACTFPAAVVRMCQAIHHNQYECAAYTLFSYDFPFLFIASSPVHVLLADDVMCALLCFMKFKESSDYYAKRRRCFFTTSKVESLCSE